jgi:glycosyl transferase family 87
MPTLRFAASSPDHRRTYLGLLVVLMILCSGQAQRLLHDYHTVVRPASDHGDVPGDFPVYYVAAHVAGQHGGDRRLYFPFDNPFATLLGKVPKETAWNRTAQAHGFEKGTMAFIYPPFGALLLRPLSYLQWPLALLFWRIIMSAMVLASIYLALLLIDTAEPLAPFIILVAATFSFFPFTETIYQGQIDPIILLCWVGGVYLIKEDRPVWSALLFAIGTLIKVSPVVVVGVFLLRRQWKWLASYAGWCVFLLGISIWRLGWENHWIWATKVLPALSQGVPYYANKSLSALIYEVYLWRVPLDIDMGMPHWLVRIFSILNVLLYGATLFYFWRRTRGKSAITYELTVLALLTLVISPVAWRHHFLLALLPLIVLWFRSRDDWRDWLVLAASTLAIGTVFVDYIIVAVRVPFVDLLLAALLPCTSLLLLIVALANYPPAISATDKERPIGELEQTA